MVNQVELGAMGWRKDHYDLMTICQLPHFCYLSTMKNASEPEALYGGTYTAKDYLSWTFDAMVELIKGKVWKMAPAPASQHQRVSSKLTANFVRQFEQKPCEVFHAPYDVYFTRDVEHFEEANTVVQPDLCVICDSHKIKSFGCVGAPDLVVEILSKSTAKKDLNDKYQIYEEFGVKEYWVVHPFEKAINLFILKDGAFADAGTFGETESMNSSLFPELAVSLEQVF